MIARPPASFRMLATFTCPAGRVAPGHLHGTPVVLWIFAVLVWGLPVSENSAADVSPVPDGREWRLPDWESRITPLQAAHERQSDRLSIAAARFAESQLLRHRSHSGRAWHALAAAHRFDPRSPTILRHLIAAAYEAGRMDVACRYALRTPQQPAVVDPLLWPQLAAYLTDSGRWRSAVTIYRQAIDHFEDRAAAPARDPRLVLLKFQMGKLCFLTQQFAESANAYRYILDALDRPGDYGVDEQLRRPSGRSARIAVDDGRSIPGNGRSGDRVAALRGRLPTPSRVHGRLAPTPGTHRPTTRRYGPCGTTPRPSHPLGPSLPRIGLSAVL